jgi:UDP-N-acetylmuramoyl-L-alanyl-D-glutamate--2,6-diaminopimelate ligase
MDLMDMLSQIPGVTPKPDPGIDIRDICSDSRQAREGSLFVALRGKKSDGRRFARDAVDRGAVAVAAEEKLDSHPGCVELQVQDARRFLAQACRVFFEDPSAHLELVAITGTNGKTSTAHLIDSIFGEAGFTSFLVGTTGARLGERTTATKLTTPEAPDLMRFIKDALNAGCSHGVLEVSSHALVQRRVFGIRTPTGVFTNLTPEHLDYHEDMEDYYEAKKALFFPEGQNQVQRAVINVDDPYGRRLQREVPCPTLSYGSREDAQVRLLSGRREIDRTMLHLTTPWGDTRIESGLIGEVNIYNILGAVGGALAQGLDLETIRRGVEALERVPGRLEPLHYGQPFTVIIDYAHTPDALEKLLQAAAGLPHERILTVFGCGGDRDRTKRPVMGEIAGRLSHYVVLTSDNPRTEDPLRIIGEIEPGLEGTGVAYSVVADRREAIERAIGMAQRGDVLILAGRGHEDYQVIGNQSVLFNDCAVARELITQLLNSQGARN